mmetsp:Transcript_30099/g.30459  ORF Transcript_30099/g.30459 Transcript_30099/m.30459 type:complete len:336 (-) Transcript_30099:238-1245(-)
MMAIHRTAVALSLLAICFPSTQAHRNNMAPPAFILPSEGLEITHSLSILNAMLDLRGGASKKRRKGGSRTASLHGTNKKTATGRRVVSGSKKEEKKSALGEQFSKYKDIMPLTRIYITLVGVVTGLSIVLGEEMTQGLLALDPVRLIYGLELWRPFTAAAFLGPPSIGWLMSAYYLFEYGSALERQYGSAQHLLFLFSQIILLSGFSIFFGQPFFGSSIITSMLHVLSRLMPTQKVKWLIFTVPYWALPYGLMAADVLQDGNAANALPHVLGILTGHFYFFHKFVWPKLGGEEWLTAPGIITRLLDPDARDKAKNAANSALRSRKRKKGRKLGGK